jgi:predicted TPR repeat methyltransferase
MSSKTTRHQKTSSRLALPATSPEELYKLGCSLHQQGKLDDAVQQLEKCIELKPDFTSAYFKLNKLYLEQNRPDFAAASLIVLLDYQPNSLEALFDLGNLFAAHRDYANALLYFGRILEIDPQNGSARHAIAALSGETTAMAPRQHVQQIFNDLADQFEEHLGDLGYRAPEHLKDMLLNAAGRQAHFTHAIDMGCGTGLSGVQFRPHVTRLTGIDLSEKMLDLAREKGAYDELSRNDACDFLNLSHRQYDLFIATDVLVYIGDLAPLFKTISDHATPGAYFVFSTETESEAKYILRPTGRYAHSRKYIEELANEFGYTILACNIEDLRVEGSQPIKGELFVLQKTGAPH